MGNPIQVVETCLDENKQLILSISYCSIYFTYHYMLNTAKL